MLLEHPASSCPTCTPEPGPGTLIASRYEITSALGQGGMAAVFRARDRALAEDVAIKVLRTSDADPDMASRFRSEVKLAWKVRHRNVCGIHEYGEDGDLLYISMELVEGVDLKRLLQERGALPWGEAYDVAVQTAEGLEAIHEAGVIHRDLKTANIMRDVRGRVRLLDFGLARIFETEGRAGITASGAVMGSPAYMSPEQVRGEALDFRSDVYSLGLVVFEVFAGTTTFPAETPLAAMLKNLEAKPPLDGPAAARLPGALVPVLRRALAKDPADRFQSCAEMVEALRRARHALDEASTQMVRATAPVPERASFNEVLARFEPAPKPRRWPLWAIAAALALLAAGYSFSHFPRVRRLPEPAAPTPVPPGASPHDGIALARVQELEARLAAMEAERSAAAARATRRAMRTAAQPVPPAPVVASPKAVEGVVVEPLPLTAPSPSPSPSLSPAPSPVTAAATAAAPVFVPPVLLLSPPLEYPPLALRQEIQGTVELRVLVDEGGAVSEVQLVSGPRELAESAIRNVQRRTYSPALRNGKPVRLWIPISVRFELH